MWFSKQIGLINKSCSLLRPLSASTIGGLISGLHCISKLYPQLSFIYRHYIILTTTELFSRHKKYYYKSSHSQTDLTPPILYTSTASSFPLQWWKGLNPVITATFLWNISNIINNIVLFPVPNNSFVKCVLSSRTTEVKWVFFLKRSHFKYMIWPS